MQAPVRFRDFERIAFFTGAGLSAESGVATYRDPGGVWQVYDYRQYACREAFDRDPAKVWDFHDERRAAVARCEPNEGHRVIAKVQREHPGTAIVTQNIDGLHQRAGASRAIELHGSLWRIRCDVHGLREENFDLPAPRRTPAGTWWRPDIIWFGDFLDPETVRAAEEAMAACDLLVTVGTSAEVYPAADLPRIAMRAGAVSVEINLADTPMTPLYTHVLRCTASQGLLAMYAD
jgi:NAD-dependent deacetylase